MILRSFTDKDMTLMENWLLVPHVERWFPHTEAWLHEIRLRNTRYSFITHLIAEQDGLPIGFCQYYDYAKGGETWNGSIPAEGSYSLDYFIGEPDYLGKGLGTALVRALTELTFLSTDAARILVQPEPDNLRSRRTLLSSGYRYDPAPDVFYLLRE